jgi:DNA (cytosine-5)-methyltransferase 1
MGDIKGVTSADLLSAGFNPSQGVITGGFPCQDLSVAGRRKGLAGERSGLFWEIHRLVAETKTKWFVLENVPGLLSSNDGKDFGLILGSLAELGYGLAYRVLDAQHFGVAQRRRRVFIVGCLGDDWRSPAEILNIGEGRAGYLEASFAKGKAVARKTTDGVGESRLSNGNLVANCLPAELYHKLTVVNQDANSGHLVVDSFSPSSFEVTGGVGLNSESWNANQTAESYVKVIRSGERDADGGLPAEVWAERDTAPTLNGMDNGGESRATVLIIDGTRVDDVRIYEDGIVPTVISRYGTGGGNVPMVFPISGNVIGRQDHNGPNGKSFGENGEPMFTQTGTDIHAIASGSTVRRLTPTECERLQGFPDNWTKISDGKMQSDSARYKQAGNAVAVPVVEWILRRIVAHEQP